MVSAEHHVRDVICHLVVVDVDARQTCRLRVDRDALPAGPAGNRPEDDVSVGIADADDLPALVVGPDVEQLVAGYVEHLDKRVVQHCETTGGDRCRSRWRAEVAAEKGLHRNRIDTKHLRLLVQEVFDKQMNEIKPYPKGRERRGVPITSDLAAKIHAWMDRHPPIPCRTRHRMDRQCGGSLLIPSKAGTVLAYNNFRRRRWNPTARQPVYPVSRRMISDTPTRRG